LGLFLIAQLAGVVPLVTVHLEHAIASEQDAAADSGDGAAVSHAHHHHVHHGSGPTITAQATRTTSAARCTTISRVSCRRPRLPAPLISS
jgi:hypothetical protein